MMVLKFKRAIVTKKYAINVHDAMCVEFKKVVVEAHNELE